MKKTIITILLLVITWNCHSQMSCNIVGDPAPFVRNEETNKYKPDEYKARIDELAERYSNEELFTKKYFNWTGTTDLGSYFVSTTSSHYDWAIKKIKSHCKKVK